jgi:trehalose 6-phosphate synthase/phosphatase
VHDYHLFRVPALIRQRIPDARIGFFLHVPFPNPEIFFTLSVRRWLMEGMLGADLIGFHTRRYRGHYTGALRRLFGIEMDPSTGFIDYEGRRVRLGIFPMGVPAADFAERSTAREVSAKTLELKGGTRLLVGVDRLDYSKGIERRLLAFERLFVRHPEWRERVRLIQVAVPSRGQVGAYRRLRTDVEALVGRINGEHSTPTWTPIHYLHRSVSPTTLMALYRAADVMLVTPLRDGMNLVAKEFIACQVEERGVLVLSRFAGAAEEIDGAILINPFNLDGFVEGIRRALAMSEAERRVRMHRMRTQIRGRTIFDWLAGIMSRAQEIAEERREARAAS